MEIRVNQTSNKTNPSSSQTNPLNNTKVQTPQPQNINNPQINQLLQILQQLMQNNNINQTSTSQNNLSLSSNGEFIVKSGMKASYIAARIENILSMKGQVVLSAMGYATPVLLDTVLLTMKDFRKMGRQVQIVSFELFEKEFNENRKIVSGLRVTLKIQNTT
jgi:hypothetical protein